MDVLAEFVSRHICDDVTRLVLDKARWPEIDMDLAVNCIESRRKLKGKVQEWFDEPELIFPRKLSAEQCSSSATGSYKTKTASEIIYKTRPAETIDSWRIADLTGGLGVDSWFFSKSATEVMYCEMLPELCDAARHNFAVLGADNITIRNCTIGSAETPFRDIFDRFNPDIIYMDPARRGEGGKKVFLIEECTPDVLGLKDELFKYSRNILIKLSPMADISMVCERLGSQCREIHVVASGGECKELLVWMDREWSGEYSVIAVELHSDSTSSSFIFSPSEEKAANPVSCQKTDCLPVKGHLFEPGKSLMKAGAFNLISKRFEIKKLAKSTHYYHIADGMTDNKGNLLKDTLKGLGKVYEILDCTTLDKRSIKSVAQRYPRAEVTARNIPMDTEMLRKKLGVTSSDDTHIFGLKSDIHGNLLIICRR